MPPTHVCTPLRQGNRQLHAGLTLDGLLARDLQLRPSSKFAYLLRPLPARAEKLNEYATRFRRRILRVVNLSRARKRCVLLALPLLVGNVNLNGRCGCAFVGVRQHNGYLLAGISAIQ